MLPGYSVIIVTYNSEKYIRRLLHSIMDEHPEEIIIVDNLSIDRTIGIIEEEFSKVILNKLTENVGFGRAVNIGVNKSNSACILVMNPDMYFHPGSLDLLAGSISPNNVSIPIVIQFDESTISGIGLRCHFTGMAFPDGSGTHIDNLEYMYNPNGISGVCFSMLKKDFIRIGGFDPGIFLYNEDTDFSWSMKRIGIGIDVIKDAILFHDHNYKSPLSSKKWQYLEFGRFRVLKRYLSIGQLLVISPSLLIMESMIIVKSFKDAGIEGVESSIVGGIRGFCSKIDNKSHCSLSSFSTNIPEYQQLYPKLQRLFGITNFLFRINLRFATIFLEKPQTPR